MVGIIYFGGGPWDNSSFPPAFFFGHQGLKTRNRGVPPLSFFLPPEVFGGPTSQSRGAPWGIWPRVLTKQRGRYPVFLKISLGHRAIWCDKLEKMRLLPLISCKKIGRLFLRPPNKDPPLEREKKRLTTAPGMIHNRGTLQGNTMGWVHHTAAG